MSASDSHSFDTRSCIEMLKRWAGWAERYWYPLPDRPELGCFATGYNAWGVQTNQKYLAAMSVLAAQGEERALDRAKAALRFSLASHRSGEIRCTDGTSWGHTWISALGIERMMYGVHLLRPHLAEQDLSALRRVLTSEADWLADSHQRNGIEGISAGLWESTGRNQPESNVWNGALLWRVAALYPDDPRVEKWRGQAVKFLVNAVSIPADEEDSAELDGSPIRGRFLGANFFPHFALDHRGFMNVGYMTICVSNAAILHFDLAISGAQAPAALHHHQGDLWKVLRRMVFADGRLARIGGATRIRYSYCQEYLLPSLLYAAHRHGDGHALGLAQRYLKTVEREQDFNGDGSFYSMRMAALERLNPYYTTRIETDRACALGMVAAYAAAFDPQMRQCTAEEEFEPSVAGHWCEPEHGSVVHRCPTRFVSFAWRSFGLTQGLCLAPQDGHLAEWERNLSGLIRVMQHQYGSGKSAKKGFAHPVHMPAPPDRRLLDYRIETFEGGFVTWGSVMEGVDLELAEGWSGSDSAIHYYAYVALPDGHTLLGMEYCRAAERRVYFHEVQGLHLNLPNDLFNGFERILHTEKGQVALQSPPDCDEVISLDSRWACLDGRLSVVGLYGADSLAVSRSRERRGGVLKSLYVEEIGWPIVKQTFAVDPAAVVSDVGWLVASSLTRAQTQTLWKNNRSVSAEMEPSALRRLLVCDAAGRRYLVLANFGEQPAITEVTNVAPLVRPARRIREASVNLSPGECRVFRVEPEAD